MVKKQAPGGVGLAIAIEKEITLFHDGKIEVESQKKKG